MRVVNLSDPEAAIAWLRSPAAIRERCALVLAAARDDRLDHFALRPERLEPTAAYVAETIAANYPDLVVPTHSRWRHFGVGGRDRWAGLAVRLDGVPREEVARVRFDLAVTSVLLDFNVEKSFVRQGNGAYLLKPVIPAVIQNLAGTVSGTGSGIWTTRS